MSLPTDKYRFERGGPFYEMVTSYMVAVCGLLFFRRPSYDPSDKVGLASIEHHAVEILPSEVIGLIQGGSVQLGTVTDSLARMLINAAYEATQARYDDSRWVQLRWKYPELEFLRHLRNAASHGGFFNFKRNEPNPNRKAEWRGKTIDVSLAGKSMFDVGIKPGDLFALLWDVEQIIKKEA